MKSFVLRFQKEILSFFYKITSFVGINLPPFASASAIIENEKKQILLVNLSYRQGYALPGGLLQANESFEAGLCREIWEETNLKVKVTNFLGHYPSNDQFPTINALYTAQITSGTLKSSVEGQVSWQKPQKIIDSIAYSDNKQGIKEYFNIS